MIRFVKAPVAASIQDGGRLGHRARGYARAGAMDPLSLEIANAAAGAALASAGVELGPGRCEIEVVRSGTIAFGGAPRDGAPWWRTLEVAAGDTIELSAPLEGVWSYLALGGGVDAPIVLGSRSTSVREGIGSWITHGAEVRAGSDSAEPARVDAVDLTGPIRLFGDLPGVWRVGRRADRMGYVLDGEPLRSGTPDEWSEPLLPGFIQIPPGGLPIALMNEGPTVGGYRVAAIVHSEDLRLLAQTRSGEGVRFIPA